MMGATLHGPLCEPGKGTAKLRLARFYPDISWPIWWLTFFSLTGLVLGTGFGPLLIVGFLASWTLYTLAWPMRGFDRMLRTLLPWAFPILALASVLWSQEPVTTLRNALELLAVTGFGILIAQAQPLRSFISAFMCAMLTSVTVGFVLGGSSKIGITGETALIGVFGSKNYFATMISFMLISSITVVFDRQQYRALRLVGAFGCLLALPLMMLTKSVGAIVTLSIALGAFGIVVLAARLPSRARPALYAATSLLVLGSAGVSIFLQNSGIMEALLRSMGKDTTLTGRTFLWQRAEWLIELKPLLGVGYQAFWVQGSVEAEGLWRVLKIPTRYGFHFHNLYYETAVELGYLGVVVLGTTLATLTAVILTQACRKPTMGFAFCVAMVVFLGSRAYVEVDFIIPFGLGSLLIPILWSYGACRPALATRPVMLRPQHGSALWPQIKRGHCGVP